MYDPPVMAMLHGMHFHELTECTISRVELNVNHSLEGSSALTVVRDVSDRAGFYERGRGHVGCL